MMLRRNANYIAYGMDQIWFKVFPAETAETAGNDGTQLKVWFIHLMIHSIVDLYLLANNRF